MCLSSDIKYVVASVYLKMCSLLAIYLEDQIDLKDAFNITCTQRRHCWLRYCHLGFMELQCQIIIAAVFVLEIKTLLGSVSIWHHNMMSSECHNR